MRMPNMNGFQFINRIWQQFLPEMNLIIMTAFKVNKIELESVHPYIPIEGVIIKPFFISKLVTAIEKISISETAMAIK